MQVSYLIQGHKSLCACQVREGEEGGVDWGGQQHPPVTHHLNIESQAYHQHQDRYASFKRRFAKISQTRRPKEGLLLDESQL